SSAFGSILGAPRILQATAMDRITPKIFAKGVGTGNEPRNALILTFFIALGGILIGELNVIARVVSIFFIITYGFLNLTCAIETWAGSDFRPSFRIPAWISIIGAIACFVVMIQLDFAAMIGATIILGAIFLLLKRKELKLQSGDTWGGVWSSLVKYGLTKLSSTDSKAQRNWRPNIMLFSGNPMARPHLIEMARTLVGKQGIFTNFELIENPNEEDLFKKAVKPKIETDNRGKKLITRKHECKNLYDGVETIAHVYGFAGFEPNTVLLGLPKTRKKIDSLSHTIKSLHLIDHNILLYRHVERFTSLTPKTIDLWWNGNSRNFNFGLSLLKYISTDSYWRDALVRIFVINYNTSKTDTIYSLLNQAADNARLMANVKVINNATERIAELDIIRSESANASLALLELSLFNPQQQNSIEEVTDLPFSTLLIEASSSFELVNANAQPEKLNQSNEVQITTPLEETIKLPEKEILAEVVRNTTKKQEELINNLNKNSISNTLQQLTAYTDELMAIVAKLFSSLEQIGDKQGKGSSISKVISDFTFQAKAKVSKFRDETLVETSNSLNESLKVYIEHIEKNLQSLPNKLIVNLNRNEFKARKNDSFSIHLFKTRSKLRGSLLGWPISHKVDIKNSAEIFLKQNRLEALNDYYEQLGLATFRHISNLRKCLIELAKSVDNETLTPDKLDELKRSTNESFTEAKAELEKVFSKIANAFTADLERNIQRFSFAIDKPETKYLVSPYRKIAKKRTTSIASIEELPKVYGKNINLYTNKNLLEFILISLNHRFSIKLTKQADELSRWANGKLTEANKELSAVFAELVSASEPPNVDTLSQKIADLKNTEVQERFEALFKDINSIIDELPETITVNDDNFFALIDSGKFPPSETREIELRQKAKLYVGTELISNARTEMDTLSSSFKELSTMLTDKLRLTLFNIENSIASHDSKESLPQNEIRSQLANEFKKTIETEQLHVKGLLEKFETQLYSYLKHALDPLHQMVYSKQHTVKKSKKTGKAKQPSFAKKTIAKIGNFLNKQFVNVVYSQSEGIMLANKLTSFESEFKVSNQSIQEMIVKLSPYEHSGRKIPFYYVSLFSGSTTLSKDLWIERPKEQQEAQRIIERFKSGFSGALIISGDRNSGKTTLSKYIAKTLLPSYNLHIVRAPKGGSTNV
ncbi:MAG TPA: hypothetical protein ENN24_03480, partial [Bacteroidetes bacterium]|nr:hypothetical protein [Bacteroidota bacterium]